MEKGNHDECDMKRRRLEKYENKVTLVLYVSDVTNPAGNFFYHNGVLRTGRYENRNGHDDDDVDGCQRTVAATNKMY